MYDLYAVATAKITRIGAPTFHPLLPPLLLV